MDGTQVEVAIVPVNVFEALVRVLDAARRVADPVEGEDDEQELIDRLHSLEESVDFADAVIDRTVLSDLLASQAEEIESLEAIK